MAWNWFMTDKESAWWQEKYEKWNEKFWKLMHDYVIGLADEDDFEQLRKEYSDL